MTRKEILISLIFMLLPISGAFCQTHSGTGEQLHDSTSVVSDTTNTETKKATGRPGAKKWEGQKKEKLYFFSGFGVSADLVGLIMKVAGSSFSQIEIAGRINIREKIFPIFELGLAESTRVGNSKDNVFHTSAPYFRVGFDINANKKRTSNRLMVGVRFGYSSFNYDFTAPPIEDPVWGGTTPVEMTDIDASAMWGEACLGFEAKIWSFIRIGWNARYKFRFSQDHYAYGQPWYIPGYGPNGSNCWGGTVNVIFDFGRTMKKGR